eukprot:GILI01024379.1.p1 GENE.GILI01024379.1~~GILI01024379.1.p1  ORF type:complete len:722 (-),score=140.07 GILI01024379.1:162-2282(-)
MADAIAEGLTTEDKVTASARRLFRARIDLGFFDPPSLTPSLTNVPFSAICTDANLRASLSAARDGIVLLKNADFSPITGAATDGSGVESVLPITADKISRMRQARSKRSSQKVAGLHAHHNDGNSRQKRTTIDSSSAPFAFTVVGPTASATTWLKGNYDQPPAWGVISILEGLYHAACKLNDGAGMVGQIVGNADLRGGDASDTNFSVSATSLNDCVEQCNRDLNCNYFTFDQPTQLCYYLRDTKALTFVAPTEGVTSGSRAGLTVMQYGYSLANITSDALSLPTPQDERECSIRCLADPECLVFTFVSGLLENNCYLRPSLSSAEVNAYAVSGDSPKKCAANSGTGPILDVTHFVPYCLDSLFCTQTSTEGLAEAVAASDAIVVVGGLDMWMEAETVDRHTLDLPAPQSQMFDLIAANYSTNSGGNPIPSLAVFVHGGTFLFPASANPKNSSSSSSPTFRAVITAGYPSMMGGLALADIITGKVSPSGKVAASWYTSNEDLPYDLSHESFYPNASVVGGNGYTYRFFKPEVPAAERFVVDFGFGLSYATFAYSGGGAVPSMTISVGKCQDAEVTFTVTRSDSVDSLENATEIAQMYIMPAPTIPYPHPLIRLTDFLQLRDMKVGEARDVAFKVDILFLTTVIDSNDLAVKPNIYTNITRRVFAGNYTLSVGPSLPTTQPTFDNAGGFYVNLVVTDTYDYDDCPVV